MRNPTSQEDCVNIFLFKAELVFSAEKTHFAYKRAQFMNCDDWRSSRGMELLINNKPQRTFL